MRKSLVGIIILAAIFMTSLPVSAAQIGDYYTVTASDFLSLRSGSGSYYTELDRLSYGTTVQIKGFSGNWVQVYVPSTGETGYVYNAYITPQGSSGTSSGSGTGTYTVTASDFLSLRTGPGSGYTEIDRLGYGTSVKVQSFSGNWAKVYVPSTGETGYVYVGYLKKGGSSGSSSGSSSGTEYTVHVSDFLALRSGPGTGYDEIDRLSNGTIVRVNSFSGNWANVYVPSRDEWGYVYTSYISKTSLPLGTRTCNVTESYLALRTEPAFRYENEIGKIWRGQKVDVKWYTNTGYAYVYAPTLDKEGYVNAEFLK